MRELLKAYAIRFNLYKENGKYILEIGKFSDDDSYDYSSFFVTEEKFNNVISKINNSLKESLED